MLKPIDDLQRGPPRRIGDTETYWDRLLARFAWLIVAACALASTASPLTASAQPAPNNLRPSVDTEAKADQLFFEAKQQAAEQKWQEAMRLLESAWQLKPSYDIAGNLGQVALTLGLYTKAATYLDRCLRMFPATGSVAQRTQVEALFREASAHVATVHIKPVATSGTLVLDRVVELGKARDPQGVVYMMPGTHIVQVRQGQTVVCEQSFLAVANASQDVHVGVADSMPSAASTIQSPLVSTGAPGENRLAAAGSATRSAVPIALGLGVSAASFFAASVLLHAAGKSVQQS